MKKVTIIAEAGVNHNGDLSLAKELVKVAANARADFVKFQTFKAEKIVSKSARKAAYQLKNMGDADASQFAMLKKLEMPDDWFPELIAYAETCGISLISTGFDEESIDFLETFSPLLYKIPSGEITNKPYLEHIATKGRKVVISTGMADMSEIRMAVKILCNKGLGLNQIAVLHCNTEYPTPMGDVNLKAMSHIQQELKVEVGYSDHTLGIEIPIAAVALGATVIEKHFTLDRSMSGPDHKASLEPSELYSMVTAIRNVELAISGTGLKIPSASELPNKAVARKSIHIAKDLRAGHILGSEDLVMKRPGDGMSPMEIDQVVNKVLKHGITAGSKLRWEDLDG